MIGKDFSSVVKAKFNFMGVEDITSKGKRYYIYYFQMETNEGLKFIKVISDISPDLANGVVLSSFNNQLTLRVI
jgi:hypothetical protein